MQAWAAFVEKYGIADVFTTAAQWGADQELEACCEWFTSKGYTVPLREARRQLIGRLLFLAQTAVDQALDLNYDDPEDYFIYRELRELKAVAAELEGQ
jgi:hypothetical protein